MRILVLLLLVSGVCWGQAQTYTIEDMPYKIDSTTGGIVYREIISVPNITADQLYTRAKSFMFKAFNNAAAVIQIDDKPGGLLAGKGNLPYTAKGALGLMTAGAYFSVPIEIRVKDNKYRYEISNIELVSGGVRTNLDNILRNSKKDIKLGTMTEKQYTRARLAVSAFDDLILLLKKTMEQPSGKEDF